MDFLILGVLELINIKKFNKMNNNEKKIPPVFEFIFKNFGWYLVFSLLYLNTNPVEWWLVQNIWGRVIILFIELSIISSIYYQDDTPSE